MQQHERVNLYLDNDKTGEKFTAKALAIDKEKFVDQRHLYKQYNDLNDWLTKKDQRQKPRLRLRP